MPTLQVLIATFGAEGLLRLSQSNLPHVDSVEYLVSCQVPDGEFPSIPSPLLRSDLSVSFSRSRGLSRNRNILLRKASANYCLIADDDLDFIPEALLKIISIFEAEPSLDILTLEHLAADPRRPDVEPLPEKAYPASPFPLSLRPKGYFVSSVEIAFRRASVLDSAIMFNENFGIGAPRFSSGEEELWIHSLLRAGLRGRFHPMVAVIHRPGASSGLARLSQPGVLRAQGAVIARLYPLSSFPRALLKSWRIHRNASVPFLWSLRHTISGWAVAFFRPRRLFPD